MALPVSVLLALVMLCSSPTCSLGCELPASHGNLESFTLWVRWRECPLCPVWGTGLTSDSSDPGAQDQAWEDRSHSCCARLAPADLPALQPTGSSAGRNESLLDRFLVGLDQQLEDLDACLREGRTLEQSPLGSENSRLAVKGYFQRISVYLKEKEYSRCAWEVVSVEIRRCLVFANKLIRKLRK